MKDDNFFTVHGWMINQLHLKGIERDLYAIIYGFTQDGKSKFEGSLSYLCEFTGAARSTVAKSLDHLIEVKLIAKESSKGGRYASNKYWCLQSENRTSTKIELVRKSDTTSPKIEPNIYSTNYKSSSLHSEDSNFAPDGDKDCRGDSSSELEETDSNMTDLLDVASDNSKEVGMVADLIKKGGFPHRIPTNGAKPSKTIEKCISLIHDIASANFLKWNLDTEWSKYNVDREQLRKVSDELYTFRDAVDLVSSVLDDYNEAKKVGNYPRDKKVLPNSFVDFLFNEHTGKSWFIHFLTHGVQVLEEVDNAKYVDQLPHEFKNMLDNEGLNWKRFYPNIARNVCDLAEWHERTRNKLDRYTDYAWLYHKEDFWQSYIDYVYDLSEGNPSKGYFRPYGKTHLAWMREMSVQYDIEWECLAKIKGEKERGYIEI